tara:strand:- start:2768 stop:2926 length:159 start_codon:yes stop_codon:yes gene_type:complete
MAERRLQDFKGREENIQDYANKNLNGNFTEAVNKLIDIAFDKVKQESNKNGE